MTRLDARDLHVWTVGLDQPPDVCARLETVLSSDERERARRFVFERDTRRFVVCRAALRRVLAQYTGTAPEALVFAYGDRGKPSLPEMPGLFFNVTHAASLGVIAVAATDVGIDVEALERNVEFEDLAARFFSAEEARELCALPADARRAAFFNCWTRKEAYIKAIGDGLSCPLDSFAVTLRPSEPALMRWIEGDDESAWHLRAFTPAEGYVGAVAVRAPIDAMRMHGVALS